MTFIYFMAVTSHMDITYKGDALTRAFLNAKARLCVHGDQSAKYDFSDIKSQGTFRDCQDANVYFVGEGAVYLPNVSCAHVGC